MSIILIKLKSVMEVSQEQQDKEYGHRGKIPGGFGVPGEDINCRCAVLQRAKWALGEDELKRLEERAKYFGMDKAKDFDDFKDKYIDSMNPESAIKFSNYLKSTSRLNDVKDYNEYKRYKDMLGKNAPENIDKFKEIKYNVSTYNEFKAYAKAINSGELSALAGFELYQKTSRDIDSLLVGITTSNGIEIRGKSNHFISRVIGSVEQKRSGVELSDVYDVLTNPDNVSEIKVNKNGSTQRFIKNNVIIVSVNPENGILIQTNPYRKEKSHA